MRPICDATLNFRSTLSAPLPLIPPPSSFLADAAGIPAPSSSGRHVDEPGPASFCKKISWLPDDDLPFLRMRFFGHQPYLGVSYSKMKTSSLEAHPHVGGLLDWSPHFMWRSSSRNRLQFLRGFHYIKPHRDTKQKPFNRFSVAVTHDAAGRHLIARLLECWDSGDGLLSKNWPWTIQKSKCCSLFYFVRKNLDQKYILPPKCT